MFWKNLEATAHLWLVGGEGEAQMLRGKQGGGSNIVTGVDLELSNLPRHSDYSQLTAENLTLKSLCPSS